MSSIPSRFHARTPALAAVVVMPTVADFFDSSAVALLEAHPNASPRELGPVLGQAAEAAIAAGRPTHESILMLLARICSMMLQPAVRTAPYAPVTVWSDGSSSMSPEHLSLEHLDLLASLVQHVPHQPLRARLADLVWLKAKRHGHAYALQAIDDYCAWPIDAGTWHEHGEDSWHRALQLARQLKQHAGDKATIIENALLAAFRGGYGTTGLTPLFFLRPLTRERAGRHETLEVAQELEVLAHREFAIPHVFNAAAYLEAAKAWFARAGEDAAVARMQALLARAWEQHADAHTDPIAQHSFYNDVIAAYRTVKRSYRAEYGVGETLERVQRKYEEAGRAMEAAMVAVRLPSYDASTDAAAAVAHVSRPLALEALLALCELDDDPVQEEYLERAAARMGESIIGTLLGSVTIAGDGRTIGRSEGGLAPAPDEVHGRALQEFASDAAMTALAVLSPALDQVRMDHALSLTDFQLIVRRSGIVPADRVDTVGKALHAGYCGDFVQALHILMPQFEYLVRQLLKQAGATTVHHDKEGLDMEVGLSSLIDRPQMQVVFGQDLTFAIRALMCTQEGPNLRNAVAHGDASDALCNGPGGVYTWWFILRLVVQQFRLRWESDDDPEAIVKDARVENGT